MPVYTYKGVSPAGKTTRGSLTAETARAARAKMRQEGIFLTEIVESSATPTTVEGIDPKRGFDFSSINLQRRIPPMEKAIATRQLATLVGASIPLVESLGALVQQIEHARLKSVMGEVRDRVNEGASLGDALDQSNQFDNLYVSMIRAGEAGGALDTVLDRIADYLEEQVRLSNRVGSILIYPLFMLVFTGVVVTALVTVVLPQITSLLVSLDQPLPFYTRWIIAGSEFLRSWWWAIFFALGLVYMGFRAALSTRRGRSIYDRFALRMPVLGRVVRVVAIARFARTLSTLLASGVGIVKSLDIARHVAGNVVIAETIDDARTQIIEGTALAVPLRNSGQFPPMVTTMIEVGERSGELESMLSKVANTYDEQVESTITRLTALLEPLLILVMVGIVLVIILATLMPLLQITNAMG